MSEQGRHDALSNSGSAGSKAVTRLVESRPIPTRATILMVATCLAAALIWQSCRTRRPEPMTGDFLSLIDGFKIEYVRQTPLERPSSAFRKEKLDGGWTRLSRLKSGVVLYQTLAEQSIETSFGEPVLYQGSTKLPIQTDLFPDGTPAGRWAWDGRRVMITTDKDPAALEYRLEYHSAVQLKPRFVKTALDHSQAVTILPGVEAYPLAFSPTARRPGVKPVGVEVFREKRRLAFEPRLLELLGHLPQARKAPERESVPASYPEGWIYVPGAEFQLWEEKGSSELQLFRASDSLTKNLFLKAGLVKFLITARADFAEPKLPVLSVFLDQRKIGDVTVKNAAFSDYDLTVFIPQGKHTIGFTFEDDNSVGPQGEAGKDRSLFLREVRLRYLDAIVVCDHTPEAEHSVSGIFAATPTVSWLRPFIFEANLPGEARTAIFSPPGTIVSYPLIVPPAARLCFGLGDLKTAEGFPPQAVEMKVRLKPASGAERTIFQTTLDGKERGWRDFEVDLGPFAGQRAQLTLETTDVPAEREPGRLTAVSTPLVISKRIKSGQPNVYIIMADAMRADHLACYGYRRATSPNLDALAREGVLFEDAISQAPWTLASVASLFTSLYSSFHGTDFVDARLERSFDTLAEGLKERGYETAAFVQNGFLDPSRGFSRGFDWYRDDPLEVTSAARLESVGKLLETTAGHKTFLYFHVLEPHSPYTPSDDSLAALALGPRPRINTSTERLQKISKKSLPLSQSEIEQFIALYDGEIRDFDALVGRFISGLKESGLYDDSMIIVTSDHGEEFKEHGGVMHAQTLYQEVIHVPLIIKFPTRLGFTARRVNAPVELIDVMPTVFEVEGVKSRSTMQGSSLLPLLSGEERAGFKDRLVVTELSDQAIALLKGKYKYIHDLRGGGEEMLFDLKSDPSEKFNRARDLSGVLASFQKERQNFQAALQLFQKEKSAAGRMIMDDRQVEKLRALGYIK